MRDPAPTTGTAPDTDIGANLGQTKEMKMSKPHLLAAGLAAVMTLIAGPSLAIDAPPDTVDLSSGIEPLARQFDAETGRHQLLVLLSPA